MPKITQSAAWRALENHRNDPTFPLMRDLFKQDSRRFERFSLRLADILFDYSKNRVTEQTMAMLLDLAREAGLLERIQAMFSGEKINLSEGRAVLHVALRNRSNRPIVVDGRDVMPDVNRVLGHMREFSDAIRSGKWVGYTGQRITDVVNIGIGGSDLGPKMATRALSPFQQPGLNLHFVSNIDGADLSDHLQELNPAQTLFLVASKTFTTQETMTNALSARQWLVRGLGADAATSRHFAAISTNREKVSEFGIDPQNMFEFWDWVGGRYSLWSAIGLPIAIAIGMDRYEELLDGAHRVDEHFRLSPLEANIPVVMGLIGVWYNNFFDAQTHAILPYDQHLEFLSMYLQQADMESNGKSVDRYGDPVEASTGPIIFGQPGTNGQHAFYQLIHQGTKMVPCDFLAAAECYHELDSHHDILLSNFIAQTEALMRGKTVEESRTELLNSGESVENLDALASAKSFPGNRPSNSLLYRRLDPTTLGSLIALYEHKVFVQGVIWGINSFDQMGVELGKQLAKSVLSDLTSVGGTDRHDPSTNGLINYYKHLKARL